MFDDEVETEFAKLEKAVADRESQRLEALRVKAWDEDRAWAEERDREKRKRCMHRNPHQLTGPLVGVEGVCRDCGFAGNPEEFARSRYERRLKYQHESEG